MRGVRGRPLVVGIDIGSSKVAAAVGRLERSGVQLLGVHAVPFDGLRKDRIADIFRAAHAVSECVGALESSHGVKVEAACVTVAPGNVEMVESQAEVEVRSPERGIGAADLERAQRALRLAPVSPLPPDHAVVAVLAGQMRVDGRPVGEQCLGKRGTVLQMQARLATAHAMLVDDVSRAVTYGGRQVEEVALSSELAALSVLSAEEREAGAIVVDIGAGTTSLAVVEEGRVVTVAAVPVAGGHISRDLAVGLRTTVLEANRVKEAFGCARVAEASPQPSVEIRDAQGHGIRRVSEGEMAEIIQARVEEILDLTVAELNRAGVTREPGAGMILTGGTSNLRGIAAVTAEYLHIPARVGVPEMGTIRPGGFAASRFAAVVGALARNARPGATGAGATSPGNTWLGQLSLWVRDRLR